MSLQSLCRLSLKRAATTITVILWLSSAISAQALGPTERTVRYFDSIRNSPPELLAFLVRMPKGGDLHSHLSGAIYAESYVQWAADVGLCLSTTTLAASVPPCVDDKVPMANALTNGILYRRIIDEWSMRNWKLSGQSGHDHFYDTFGKFGPATYNQTGAMLAEVASRAARQNVSYLELMLTPEFVKTYQIANVAGWDGNFESALAKLKSNGIEAAAADGIKNLQDAEALKDRLLMCGTTRADPGCGVVVRYIAQVSRGSPLRISFAAMTTGFILANTPDSKVVAVNLVQAEDAFPSMANFSAQMQMLRFLKPLYPRAHLTLHAGELAPGMVPPEALTFHVRASILAGAERIGHGVSVMHETDAEGLLREMAQRNVLVETCLSSNDMVLGISGRQHPLATYLKYGVPIALATDDEGVLRSEMSREYLRAVEEHGLQYVQLKMIARNSLEYSFIAGASLWSDRKKFTPVSPCAANLAAGELSSSGCRQFIETSEKAKLQWKLEQDFRQFELKY